MYVPVSLLGIVITGAVTWQSAMGRIDNLEKQEEVQNIRIEKNEDGVDGNKENTVILKTQLQYIVDSLDEIKDTLKKIE